jgi:hypothetical protein
MDRIYMGPIFDDVFALATPKEEDTLDPVATHRNRDAVLISTLRAYGDALCNGIMDSREVGQYLKDMATEAEQIESEVKFGYEK